MNLVRGAKRYFWRGVYTARGGYYRVFKRQIESRSLRVFGVRDVEWDENHDPLAFWVRIEKPNPVKVDPNSVEFADEVLHPIVNDLAWTLKMYEMCFLGFDCDREMQRATREAIDDLEELTSLGKGSWAAARVM